MHVWDDQHRTVRLEGEVLDSEPPKHLVLNWPDPSASNPARHSRVTFKIEQIGDEVRLNVIHGNLGVGSEMARAISANWPRVLDNMKRFFEQGMALDTWTD